MEASSLRELCVSDLAAADGDALVDHLQVRARVEARIEAGGGQQRRAHASRRTLAVRPGDVNDRIGRLRVAHDLDERSDAIECRQRVAAGLAGLDRLEIDVPVQPRQGFPDAGVQPLGGR